MRSPPLIAVLVAVCCFVALFIGADMTPETDENGGDPHTRLASPAPAATPATRERRDALRAGTVVPVALGLMLGIAYLGYANVQRQIKRPRC